MCNKLYENFESYGALEISLNMKALAMNFFVDIKRVLQ